MHAEVALARRLCPVILLTLALLVLTLGGARTSAAAPPAQAAALRIEAENYARYEDIEARNVGDAPAYAAPGPDVFRCASSCSNGHKVGAFYGGEWLEFAVAIPQRQAYTLLLRYGTRNDSSVAQVLVDGRAATEHIRLASTGHYDRLATQSLGTVALAAGTRRVRLIAHGPYSFDYLELQPLNTAPPPPPTPSPTTPPAPTPSQASTWQRWEATLTSARAYANPYADVSVSVSFRGPAGQQFASAGFWDGGSTFRIRAMFPSAGTWSWETSASDTSNGGLHAVRGSVSVRASSSNNPLPARGGLRVSTDGRYLTHADGTPFFWLGDTAWAAPLKATPADWETYLADRAAKGFSVVQIAASPRWAASANAAGAPPWLGASGVQWNPAYWQAFDQMVAAANRRGLVVLVVGLMEPDGANLSGAAAQRFARQLVGRLHGDHVVFSPSFDSPYHALGDTVGAAIAEATSQHLITQHPGTPSGQATNGYAETYYGRPYLSFSGNQSGHNGGDRERVARQEIAWNLSLAARSPTRPVINLEGYYDNAGGQPDEAGAYQGTAKDARAGAYRSWLSGALGYSYGTGGLFRWETVAGAPNHWRTALAYPSSRQMGYLRGLLMGLPWQTLRPAHTRLREQPAAYAERAVLAITADRRVGLAYTPLSRPVTIDMAGFAGPVHATWVNPTTNQRSAQAAATSNAGVARFTPPAGGDDWLLLLQP